MKIKRENGEWTLIVNLLHHSQLVLERRMEGRGGGSSESRYSRLRGWNAIPRDPIKSRFPLSPSSLSLSLSLSHSHKLSPTVPLFRNDESRNFGNELSRGNPKKREKEKGSEQLSLRAALPTLRPFDFTVCSSSRVSLSSLITRGRKKAHSCWQMAIYDVS